MRKLLIALVLTTALCLGLAAVAAADPGNVQGSDQSATTEQGAGAASGATQIDPSNTNISIRVLSPGDDGSVSQSNTAGSSATAGNQAGTTQTAGQGSGGSGIQTSQQAATTDQLALALSAAAQAGATNLNTPVRVLSPGSNGDVTQSNTVGSQASSGNSATTGQTASQGQGGSSCGCGGSGVQTSKQAASTDQGAGALSTAKQDDPSNANVSIRVLSPGGNGSVSQSNTAGSSATAGNSAGTTQGATQASGGTTASAPVAAPQAPVAAEAPAASAPAAAPAPATSQSNTAGSSANAGNQASTTQGSTQGTGSGSGIQVGDQSAATDQLSGAFSHAEQDHPSNTAGSVRVLSPGDDGSVTQSNTVGSSASAGNSATTRQSQSQAQGASCGCGSSLPIQVAGQQASTDQGAIAASEAEQAGAANTASPVRVLSPGSGGAVTQSNTVGSQASAGNDASTTQSGSQTAAGGCRCGGEAIQVAGQKADTEQGSLALSKAVQAFGGGERTCGCGGGAGSGNDASPVRVWSPGSDGSVTQSNTVGSSASSGNRASTTQDTGQTALGPAIQVAGQEAGTGQLAFAASLAAQLGASNTADPVRVKSPGGGGSVSQSNTAGSSAASGNAAATGQRAGQTAGGSCGCSTPIQVSGQKADTWQAAAGLSAALQLHPENVSSPVDVWNGDRRREAMPAM